MVPEPRNSASKRPGYLAILLRMRADLDVLIERQQRKLAGDLEAYEQRKARGLCTGNRRCEKPPVPQHTQCAYHLRIAWAATNRRRAKQPEKGPTKLKGRWRLLDGRLSRL